MLLLLATSSGIISCKKEGELTSGFVGTWQLSSRQCYCPPSPTPTESVAFTPTRFAFFENGTVTYSGTYTSTTKQDCQSKTRVRIVRLIRDSAPNIKVRPREAIATRNGNTLVLDYNVDCLVDGPVDTYELQP